MKTDSEHLYVLHFFVCCNERENKKDCATKGGKLIRDDLKKWAKEQGFGPYLRINQSGCLDRCEQGVAAVAYPQEEWCLNLTVQDLPALKERIEEWVVGGVLSDAQLEQFESGTIVTVEPLSRVKHVVKNRLSRIGKKLPIANEAGKILFSAKLTQAEVVRFDEIPPIVLELLGYGDDRAKFDADYHTFWKKHFPQEELTGSSQLWVCVWRKE